MKGGRGEAPRWRPGRDIEEASWEEEGVSGDAGGEGRERGKGGEALRQWPGREIEGVEGEKREGVAALA